MALSLKQQQAVDCEGHLRIVAGPGSGKTTTSVAKALKILENPSNSLLMLTFTRAGADEMRTRLHAALKKKGRPIPQESQLTVATFHSVVIKHLKRHGKVTRILPPAQQDILLRDAMMAVGVGREDQDECKKTFELYQYSLDRSGLKVGPDAAQVIEIYARNLAQTGSDDLYTVMRNCALMVSAGEIPTLPFTHMIVDEVQDTDALQQIWVFKHASAGTVVTMVGDDDQSIYEWRHALGFSCMQSFVDTFDVTSIELGANYRCKQEILDPAVKLIELNKERIPKHLTAERGSGGFSCRLRTSSDLLQNEAIAEAIVAIPQAHQDCAVLARNNRSLDNLELVLRAHGVEYRRSGKSIWDLPQIAALLGFLDCLVNSTSVGLLPVLNGMGFSPIARTEILGALLDAEESLLDGHMPALDTLDQRETGNLGVLIKDTTYWRRQLRAGSFSEVILDVSDSITRWLALKGSMRDLVRQCGEILARLDGTITERLRFVSGKGRNDARAPVNLMTMHGAKGLEFETVYVIDVNDKDDGASLFLEAERRLAYVAMTRAKNSLIAVHWGKLHPAFEGANLTPIKAAEDMRALLSAASRVPA